MTDPHSLPGSSGALPSPEPEIEIFRSGDYGPKGRYTSEDLQTLADDYSRSRLDAPLTLDHAQSGPAHGWVAGLRRMGDRLYARLTGVGDAVRRFVADGAYRRCSIELIRRHPQTGRPYLRAVTLLGAATPAVDGLEPVRFSNDSRGDDTSPGDDATPTVHLETVPDPSDPHLLRQLEQELRQLRQECFSAEALRLTEQLRDQGCPLVNDAAERITAFARSHDPGSPVGNGQDTVGFSRGLQDHRPLLDLLRTLFRPPCPPVPLDPALPPNGPTPILPPLGDHSLGNQAEAFAQAPAPEGQLHGQALRLMGLRPGLSYARALIEAARSA
jgi:hypothetical protein